MESLKRERRPLRTGQTKLISALKTEIEKSEPDRDELQVNLQLLEENFERLSLIDGRIMSEFSTDENTGNEADAEFESITEYARAFKRIKIKVERILQQDDCTSHVSSAHSHISSAQSHVSSKERNYRLPKVELRKFNGEYKEWIGWWAQFEKIHLDETLHASDKFQYLAQSMVPGTRAYDLVQRYPQSGENYEKVIGALVDRFGNKKILIQIYVRELLQLIIKHNNQQQINNLSKLYDNLETDLRVLETLGVTTEMMALFLYPMVESTLSEELLIAWQRSSYMCSKPENSDDVEKTELQYLMEFLQQEVKNEDQRRIAKTGFIPKTAKSGEIGKVQQQRQAKETYTAVELFTGEPSACTFCEKPNHNPQDCLKAQQMTRAERFEKLKQKGLCASCFKPNHISKFCKFPVRCVICAGRHYGIMCQKVQPSIPDLAKNVSTEKTKMPTSASNYAGMSTEEVLLKSVMVRVVGKKSTKTVRLIFDDGSQKSYISRRVAIETGCNKVGEEVLRNSLFGGTVTAEKTHRVSNICLQNLNTSEKHMVNLCETSVICGALATVPRGAWVEQLRKNNIVVDNITTSDVDILIGSDLWGRFVTGRKIVLECGLIAWETTLGWTVSGVLKSNSYSKQAVAMTVTALFVNNLSVPDLWSLETIGIEDYVETKSKREREEYAKQEFLRNAQRDESGRYIVSLPWKEENIELPDNFTIAKRRLETLTKKLLQQEFFEEYDKIFQQWLDENFIEEVSDDHMTDRLHYLPHRAVIRPNNETTPVRIVFDASCKDGRNPSLNDCLEVGPNLMELIVAVLIRFRIGVFGVIADIRKAFQMIEVRQEDRDVLRFLWWSSQERNRIKIYRHKRVVFGVNCSPFLLGAVLNHHIESYEDERKAVAQQLGDSFYVDNCVTTVDSISEYEHFRNMSTDILADAQMELRQWESNCYPSTNSDETYVLGVQWNKNEDVLLFDVPREEIPENISKRQLLSMLHKIYDPLGFLAPTLIVIKLVLQNAWRLKTNWDDELPPDLREMASNWWKQMVCLNEVKIPRFVMRKTENVRTIQIHGFGDASKSAYAAVVFLRIENADGVTVKLIQAKSRIAPVTTDTKPRNIPRMELLASLITARLVNSVIKALKIDQPECFYWTDSSTVLAWINRYDEWGTFVGNRVKEILQTTDVNSWRHVPGSLNPADLPSRGCSPSALARSNWWAGPEWLLDSVENWPNEAYEINEEEVLLERRKTKVSLLTTSSKPTLRFKYSSYRKNIRVYCYVLRFINACRKKGINNDFIEVSEIEQTELAIWKYIQRQAGIHTLETIHGIRVEMDNMGLVRVKTKLLQRDDDYNLRLPVLLPNDHEMVTKMIMERHIDNSHAGVQIVMGMLRENVWILQGRRNVRKLIKQCVTCKRYSGRNFNTVPAPLPKARVTDGRVFETTGVDLAGPLYLKDGSKTWFVLFTCAVYRCIHLELVDSLSTESFLMSLQRFVSRRGRPSLIYSDNGSNFVGAVNLFKTIDWERVYMISQTLRIQWRFNPPTAAWWGGWWERLIRTIKELLRRMLGHKKLNFVQLETCLCQVEAIVNERPLTYVTEDKDDLIAITPAMFMRDIRSSEVPEMQLVELSDCIERKYKNLETLKSEIRSRFRKEYLSQLVQRGGAKSKESIKIGDVVLIETETKKRVNWPLGRVTRLYAGVDGQSRVAEVKTTNGTFTRPIQRLYSMEVDVSELPRTKSNDQCGSGPHEIYRSESCGREPQTTDVDQGGRGPSRIPTKEQGEIELLKLSPFSEPGRCRPNAVTKFGRKVKAPLRYDDKYQI